MTTTTASSETQARKAWTAATKATAAAHAAIQPYCDQLAAARDALASAQAEALDAIAVKSVDPAAARERIEKARAAIKTAEDDVQWAILELNAAEARHEQAHTDEQAARRAVTAAEYVAAHREWNDENNRENQLLRQLKDNIAELIPMINDRKNQHDRLAQEWAHLPTEERPQLKAGQPITDTSTRLIGEHIADITPEVSAAIKAGAAAAQAELTARRRAAQHG